MYTVDALARAGAGHLEITEIQRLFAVSLGRRICDLLTPGQIHELTGISDPATAAHRLTTFIPDLDDVVESEHELFLVELAANAETPEPDN